MKNMRKIIAAITVVSTLLFATACKDKNDGDDNNDNANVDLGGNNNVDNGGNNDDAGNTCTHTFGDWTIDNEASCSEAGLKTRECSICGYEEEVILDKLAHNFVNGECDDCGEMCGHSFTDGVCTDCGKICEHIFNDGDCDVCEMPCDCTYGDWHGNDATCEDKGHEYRECNVCGHVDSRETDALGHNYEGRKCTRCGDTDYTLPPQPLGNKTEE